MARRRFDKQRADRLLVALRDGAPFRLCARAEGLSAADVRDWESRRPEFARALAAARSHSLLAPALTLARAAESDWHAAARLSERRDQVSELERLRLMTAGAA